MFLLENLLLIHETVMIPDIIPPREVSDRNDPKPTNNNDETDLIPPIKLLEERLVVEIDRQKVGEVIVRKEVETQIIEVPIRREKLIVEQISPEYKQIAIIDLGSDRTTSVKVNEVETKFSDVVIREFESVKLASQYLEAIAHLPDAGCKSVKIEIKVEDTCARQTYEELLNNITIQTSFL